MDVNAFSWVDDVTAACLTVVEGLSPSEVASTLGAEAGSHQKLLMSDAELAHDFGAERFAVQIDTIGAATIVVEPNGYICSQDSALAALSRSGRAMSVFWNVNMDSRVALAEHGTIVRAFDPVLGSSSVGDPRPAEHSLDPERPIASALALMAIETGVQLTPEWLAEPRDTWVCPLSPKAG